jgi:tellurite resistance protein TehA-like permease
VFVRSSFALFACRIWRKRGHSFSAFREVLLILGVVLIVETLIISTLSNYNLGVILPAFFGVPMVFLAFVLPHMKKGFLRFLKWLIAVCYGVAFCIFIVCGFLMVRASTEGKNVGGRDIGLARRCTAIRSHGCL